jgi:hypothetical protein
MNETIFDNYIFSGDSYFLYMENGETKTIIITKGDVNDKYYRYKMKWTNKNIHMPETEYNPPTPFCNS